MPLKTKERCFWDSGVKGWEWKSNLIAWETICFCARCVQLAVSEFGKGMLWAAATPVLSGKEKACVFSMCHIRESVFKNLTSLMLRTCSTTMLPTIKEVFNTSFIFFLPTKWGSFWPLVAELSPVFSFYLLLLFIYFFLPRVPVPWDLSCSWRKSEWFLLLLCC